MSKELPERVKRMQRSTKTINMLLQCYWAGVNRPNWHKALIEQK